jgi:hypothetical protein
MGGRNYDRDVAANIRASGRSFDYEREQQRARPQERRCHEDLNPKGAKRECLNNPDHPQATPIVIGTDTTQSRGKDADTIYGKLPRLVGQTYEMDLVPDPTLSICGIGDATTDIAPIQSTQFEADNRLDDQMLKLWRENNGGGTGEESYQHAAYFYARHTILDATKRGEKGWFIFMGDEAPYPTVKAHEVKRLFGDDITKDIDSRVVFQELQEKFRTYLIFPRSNMDERRKDIEKEMKRRVEEAGALFENTDVRFTLSWHNRNDLDLHCITPSGDHIYFSNKRSSCGGELDVDRNVHGETTKPVENIRWKKDQAPRGKYKVFVRNFAFHENSIEETPFEMSTQIGNDKQFFEGKTEYGKTGEASDVLIGEFYYDPDKQQAPAKTAGKEDPFDNYRDEIVLAKWEQFIPSENILRIKNPRGVIDLTLGIMAIVTGKRTLEQFLSDLKDQGQDDERIADVREALTPLSEVCSLSPVSLPPRKPRGVRKSGSRLI